MDQVLCSGRPTDHGRDDAPFGDERSRYLRHRPPVALFYVVVEPGKSAVFLAIPSNRNINLAATYRLICDRQHISRFCQLFREFERRLSPTMRQQHVAGQKGFVDYSGKRVPIVDPLTGEVMTAEIFVAVLGASNLTYAEATWTQTLPDWIGSHVRLFRFWGAERWLALSRHRFGSAKGLSQNNRIIRLVAWGRWCSSIHRGRRRV